MNRSQHRVFIAVNLPENISKKLAGYHLKWPELPCRWVKKENLHITLAFLGYLTNEELLEVCKITEEIASRYQPFFISLTRIIYGPPGKTPRLVWAEGEKSKELATLQKDTNDSLSGLSGKSKKEQGRGYVPHITLGRLKMWEFKNINPEERSEVKEEINLNFEVNSIEVMESRLKRAGPEYTILESCSLNNS